MVRTAGGAPAAGIALTLLAAVDGRWRQAGTTWTGADGRFSVLAGSGPSRRLVIAAGAVRSRPLRLAVRASIRLRAVRQGDRTLVRGTLRGGHIPPGGILVTIEARRGRRWARAATLVTDRHGRFGARLAHLDTRAVRATVTRQPGYPFAAGTSAPG
jgi:5-hydroxyisourate hydrolase-like protein (transthyretin family)